MDVVGKGSHLLFCVDDSKFDRTRIKNVLKEQYDVVTLPSGEDAFELLDAGVIPALILLDITMEGMNGFEFMERLSMSPSYENLPVIFITSEQDAVIEAKCLALGAVDFVRKPFDDYVLFRRVNKVLSNETVTSYMTKALKQYEKSLEKEHVRYKMFMQQMLKALSLTIDAKDVYTRGHSSRVAYYSQMIGRGMDLEPSLISALYYAGMLHDIGKIGVSDTLLRKEGQLSEAELAAIHDHPVIGYNILAGVSAIPEIAQGARWHHERYDGSGYPDSLVGNDIPLIARIICIADSFDAMTSRRSYQEPKSFRDGLLELEACAGTQFDPEIVPHAVDTISKLITSDGVAIVVDEAMIPDERRIVL